MRTWLARLRPRSIYDVMAVIGCVAAVGTGTAYAANTVFSTDIVDGEVKNADIAGNSITSNRIYPGSVLTTDIGDNAVNSSKVVDESLASSDLASNSVGATEIADSTIDSGEIVNDSLGAADLAPNAVAPSELANNTVTGGKVANNSLTTADVAGTDSNGSITLGTGSVANGRCKSYDITIGGAKTNQTLIISARATLPAGLLIYGQRVPADGHGTMTVCNLSGATMPALTDFPIRTVTFG